MPVVFFDCRLLFGERIRAERNSGFGEKNGIRLAIEWLANIGKRCLSCNVVV